MVRLLYPSIRNPKSVQTQSRALQRKRIGDISARIVGLGPLPVKAGTSMAAPLDFTRNRGLEFIVAGHQIRCLHHCD